MDEAQGRKRRKVADRTGVRNASSGKLDVLSEAEKLTRGGSTEYGVLATMIEACEELDDGSREQLEAINAVCMTLKYLAETDVVSFTSQPSRLQAWLRERWQDFADALLRTLKQDDEQVRALSLYCYMTLLRYNGHTRQVEGLAHSLLACRDEEVLGLLDDLNTKYLQQHFDLRLAVLSALARMLEEEVDVIQANAVTLLTGIMPSLEHPADGEERFFHASSPSAKTQSTKLEVKQKKRFESCWLAVLRRPLEPAQYKQVLNVLHKRIIPHLPRPQMLMDFLTDSYNIGGIHSLLALNGLYELIVRHNLEYPSFYNKLYAMLDFEIMFSKYKSRFLRMLDVFLMSSHLSSNLVASFIKRLSIIASHSGPSGIVSVVPLVYNLLKRHPSCMVLLQRSGETDFDDKFNLHEQDPEKTGALSSSLWELMACADHYHGSVASIVKILQEQFHRERYDLEHFINHSYGTMLLAEAKRKPPKEVATEFQDKSLFEFLAL